MYGLAMFRTPSPHFLDDTISSNAPDFVVIDVETACSRVSSICQIGIVGFRGGQIMFEYETLLDPRDHFSSFNTRIHGIAAEHVLGQPCFGEIHEIVDRHLGGRITVAHSYFDKGRWRRLAGSMIGRSSTRPGWTA